MPCGGCDPKRQGARSRKGRDVGRPPQLHYLISFSFFSFIYLSALLCSAFAQSLFLPLLASSLATTCCRAVIVALRAARCWTTRDTGEASSRPPVVLCSVVLTSAALPSSTLIQISSLLPTHNCPSALLLFSRHLFFSSFFEKAMTDLYQHNQNSYPPPPQSRQSNPYPHLVSNPNAYSSPVPAPQPSATHSTTSSGGGSHSHSGDEHDESDSPPKSQETSPTESKPPQKTQSTFLTKLYAYVLAHAAFFS